MFKSRSYFVVIIVIYLYFYYIRLIIIKKKQYDKKFTKNFDYFDCVFGFLF
jgi:hypothetical protein